MVLNLFKKNKPEGDGNLKKGYLKLKVKDIIKETNDAISIVFDLGENQINYTSGQFLTLIVNINGNEQRRAYSLCSSPYTDSDPAVTVKRVQDGLVSNWLNDNLNVEDEMLIMEPMGNFTTSYDKNNKRHIIMFGGGSGITPLMSISKSVLHEEPDSIVSIIYCNRDINSIIFKDSLDQLQQSYEGRFRVIHVLDEAPMNWQGPSGLLNHDMLQKLFERIPNWGQDKSTYLMCGPEGMMNNVQSMLEEMNLPKENIFRESFVAGIMNKDEEKGSEEIVARDVTVDYDGEVHTFTVEPGTSILDTALDNDIDLPYSCQSGLCTACRCKLVSGKVKMDEDEGLSQSEKEQGFVLICTGHPLTDDVKLKVG